MKKLLYTILFISPLFLTDFAFAQSTLGIEENSFSQIDIKDKISIQLDATSNYLKINNKSGEEIKFVTIHNNKGQIILSSPYSRYADNTIDITSFKTGEYGLVLKQNNKIVKKIFQKRKV